MKVAYLSVRWKIILLAGFVLGLISALFIWQQYKYHQRDVAVDQTEFRERSGIIENYLFESQSERMQMLANVLVAQPNVQDDIVNHRGDKLAERMGAIATELSFNQGVETVVFHDASQQQLSVWGNPDHVAAVLPCVKLAALNEKPETHVTCDLSCVQQTVIPVSFQGHTIATLSIVSNLESILSDLHRLSNSDVAVLKGRAVDDSSPLAGMRIVSVSGGDSIRSVLNAARNSPWQNGLFQFSHSGQVHQVISIPMPFTKDKQTQLALISDVTNQIQSIDSLIKNNFLQGFAVLFAGLLLLYAMLRPTMRRIQHVSQILPLLGQEKFTQVREGYETRPQVGKLTDEVDELEGLALALAGQLEYLKNESVLHEEWLNLQASELKHERDFISGLFDTAPVLILSYAGDGLIQTANAYARQVNGPHQLTGRCYASLFLGMSQDEYTARMAEMKAGAVTRMESRVICENGGVRDVLWFHSRLTDGLGKVATYLSVGMDITEHKENEAQIYDMAFYDSLTRLPNRRRLSDCIQHAMAGTSRNKGHCALAFIDLDHFKSFNDSRGQEAGDRLLIEVAGCLRLNVREFDTVAHLGADEFVVLLEELSEDVEFAGSQVRLICEKLRFLISQLSLQGVACHLTASVGISLFSGHEASVDEVLRHANIAMSNAKAAGRNTLCFFDPAMQTGIVARTELQADLHRALSQDQFRLFYQVQSDINGKPVGAEALLRWIHPERGVVSPLQFIPLAEESELILPIGLWVLQTACAQIKAWETDSSACGLQVAVNVSVRQFHRTDFVPVVLQTLRQSGANPAQLKLELTESMLLGDIEDSISKMQQLRQFGVRIAIDDFGTAYSSLSYLTQLPLDQLKIDQSFVRNIGVKPGDAIIVKTIINMANNLDMDVIAEGVETEDQRDFLQQAGCQVYQGYLYSKPLALHEFSDYLTVQ